MATNIKNSAFWLVTPRSLVRITVVPEERAISTPQNFYQITNGHISQNSILKNNTTFKNNSF